MSSPRIAMRLLVLVSLFGLLVSSGPAHAESPCQGNSPDSPGLLSRTEYEGPMFGNAVTWERPWKVATLSNEYVAAVTGEWSQPVDCEGNTGDLLTLVHRRHESTVIEIHTFQRGMWTFSDMADAMQHPGWTTNLGMPQGSPVILTETSNDTLAMLARSSDDPAHVAYHVAFFPEDADTIMSVTIHTWDESTLAEDLAAAESGIDLGPMDLFALNNPEQIANALDD